MKLKILSQTYNPLLKRKEVIFELDHNQEGQTPPRLIFRDRLANELKTKPELVFIEKMVTRTGTTTAMGEANVYDTRDQAHLVERKHIITRNLSTNEPPVPQKPEKKSETPMPTSDREPVKEKSAENKDVGSEEKE